jgi:hypothetical protein
LVGHVADGADPRRLVEDVRQVIVLDRHVDHRRVREAVAEAVVEQCLTTSVSASTI